MEQTNSKKYWLAFGLIAATIIVPPLWHNDFITNYYYGPLPWIIELGLLIAAIVYFRKAYPKGSSGRMLGLAFLMIALVFYSLMFLLSFDGGCTYQEWLHDLLAHCDINQTFPPYNLLK